MSWARLDDGFESHRKVQGLDLGAVGLWTLALSYAARYATDGVVEERWLRARVPEKRRRDKLVRDLVEAGLFERLAAGEKRELAITERALRHGVSREVEIGPFDHETLLIHDFLTYNESAAEAEARRAKERERKSEQRRKQGERRNVPVGHRADASRSPSSPTRTRPDPTPPLTAREEVDAARAGAARRCTRCEIEVGPDDGEVCSPCARQLDALERAT